MGDTMCGRFVISYTNKELVKLLNDDFHFVEETQNFSLPRYNIAPQQEIISLIKKNSTLKIGELKWWYSDEKLNNKLINIRIETIIEKKRFLDSYRKRRCIIIASGFYEWDDQKRPYYFYKENGKLMYFAGIYNKPTLNEKVFTSAIITKNSEVFFSDVHGRMPIILTTKEALNWLNHGEFLNSEKKGYQRHIVSSYVNDPRNDDVTCIKPI